MFEITLTGKEDREGPWKIAVCGFPGAGKSLFATTAPETLFVFFKENPPLKSIAPRAVAKTHLYNRIDPEGALVTSVQDQLSVLHLKLLLEDHSYKTLVLDTGNELFMEMKAARRLANRGQFGPGDWDWIADTYREAVTSLIDLPMNVIVLYHLKAATVEDQSFREVALQGAVKDEFGSWFDIVGVLDTYEVVDEDGATETRRAFLTRSNAMYPWLKDHSGNLPRYFDISEDFVGDYKRLIDVVEAMPLPVESRQVLEEVQGPELLEKGGPSVKEVPSPEELVAEKSSGAKKSVVIEVSEPIDTEEASPIGSSEAATLVQEDAPAEIDEEPSPEEEEKKEDTSSMEDAQALIEEILGGVEEKGEEKDEPFLCVDCLKEDIRLNVSDEGIRDVATIRYRVILCKPHYIGRRDEDRNA